MMRIFILFVGQQNDFLIYDLFLFSNNFYYELFYLFFSSLLNIFIIIIMYDVVHDIVPD